MKHIIFILTFALCSLAPFAMPQSAHAEVIKLGCGVTLDLPGQWEKQVFADGEAGSAAGQEKLSFLRAEAAGSAGALVQVNILPAKAAGTYSSILAKASPELLREMENEFFKPNAQQMVKSGLPLLNMNPLRTDTVGGRSALVISYRRQGVDPKEVWEVSQYKIPLPDYMVEVILGANEAQQKQMAPVLFAIKNSVRIEQKSGVAFFSSPVVVAEQAAPEKLAVSATAPGGVSAAASAPTTSPVIKASFNCAKASTAVESAICNNAELAAMDVDLAKAYSAALKADKANALQLRQQQMDWLKNREAQCHGPEIVECLRRGYEERTVFLHGLSR